jgi:tRNA G37 N-methylase TrmD
MVMVIVATVFRLIPHRMQISKRHLSESFTTQSALR